MHGNLKKVALKFDEGEKNRQARLRKARKEIEFELDRLTQMNETLFSNCKQFQDKYMEQVENCNQLSMENQDLLEDRKR